jgi:hypothetical protein
MTKLTASLGASVALAALLASPALSADFTERFEGAKPAVSGLNGKVDFGYSYLDIDGVPGHLNVYSGVGSISAPVGQSFGVQIDAGLISLDPTEDLLSGIDGGGVGGHFFWRNPDQGLLGAYAHYVTIESDFADADIFRYGIEGELYLDRVTLEGFAGADTIDVFGGDETYEALDFTASYYVNDNVRLSAGVSRTFDETAGLIGAEAMLPFASNNVSLYAKAQFGDDSTSVGAGLRVYFGDAGKSLIARHREDDPESQLFDFAQGGGFGNGSFDGPSTPSEYR